MNYLYFSYADDDLKILETFLDDVRSKYKIVDSACLSTVATQFDDAAPALFVPFFSSSYMRAPNCIAEIYSAYNRNIPIMPVSLESDPLKDGMWIRFSHLPQLNFHAEDFYDRFAGNDAVKTCLTDGTDGVGVTAENAGKTAENAGKTAGSAGSGESGTSGGPEPVQKNETDDVDGVSVQTITYPDGSVYKGNVENGVRSGHGRLTISDGRIYVGMWKNDKYEGDGTFTWPDGGKYEGDWEDGVFTGKGTRVYKNGDTYEGEWRKGKFHGQGIYTWADGSVYEGEWSHDHFSGEGKYTWPDGTVFTGQYQAGERNGRGEMRFADGTVLTGEWQNGVFMENAENG